MGEGKRTGADFLGQEAIQRLNAPFARTVIEAAPDRVLWGTDWPHPNVRAMPNDGENLDLFAAFCADERLRRKVLIDNPTQLYWSDARRA